MAEPDLPLPAHARALLHQIADAVRRDEVHLFGGAALDLILDPSAPCHDLDVAVTVSEPLDESAQRLRSFPEFSWVGELRRYWIRLDQPVVMVDVCWGDHRLDVNFVNHLGGIGHFDVEQVRWSYPDHRLIDPWVVSGRPVENLRLTTAPDADNPLLLLNRLLKLSAKYQVEFWRREHLRNLVADLVERSRSWLATDPFHGPQAHAAHARSIASAVRRSVEPVAFLEGCIESGLLRARFEPLSIALRSDVAARTALATAASDDAFWRAADLAVGSSHAAWREWASPCGRSVRASVT